MASTNRLHVEYPNLSVEETSVFIVGGSMVGMTLAVLLAQHGVKDVITAEKHPGTAIHPRAALFHPRTTQIYRELGMYDRMQKESNISYDNHSSIVVTETLAGKLLSTLMADMNEGIGHISPTERLFLSQNMFEPLMKQSATEGGARLEFSTEVVDFEQDGDGVSAILADARTGHNKRLVRAKYLVAADGNRSPIREKLGIPMHGHGMLSRSITIYFRAQLSHELRNRYTGVIYVNNDKLRGFFRLDKVGEHDFLVVLAAGERGTEQSRFVADYVTDDLADQLLRDALGIDVKYEITQVVQWIAVCDNAEQYSKGRIHIAGDAAHTVTPHGGYGGNTGIHDAHNLSWKLALVLSDKAAPELLDTYHEERHPVGKQTVDQVYHHYVTRTAHEFIVDGWDRHLNLVTDYFLELGYRYHSKALDTSSLDTIVEDPENSTITPGSIAHHVMIQLDGNEEKIPIADLLGHGFVLLTGSQGAKWEAAVRSLEREPSLPIIKAYRIVNDAEFCPKYGIEPAGAVLVRPDGFVAWKTVESPSKAMQIEDPDHMLAKVLKGLLWFVHDGANAKPGR